MRSPKMALALALLGPPALALAQTPHPGAGATKAPSSAAPPVGPPPSAASSGPPLPAAGPRAVAPASSSPSPANAVASSPAAPSAIARPPVEVFETRLAPRTSAAKADPSSFHVQHWVLGRGVTIVIPLEGPYLAQLRIGGVRATVDGAASPHQPGDMWMVKAGSTMSVQSLGESAVIETIVAK